MNIGALVIYHGRSAAVAALGRDKIDIRIEGGGEKSVRPKDIAFLHPGPVTALPPPAPAEPDWGEIVELMGSEKLSFSEFIDLAYGSGGASAAYAGWRELESELRFTGSVTDGVQLLPLEVRTARAAALQAKINERAARAGLLERIGNRAVLDSDRPALREIEAVALGTAPASRLMRELGIEAVPEKAHKLLLDLKVWTLFRNPWPSRLGVESTPPVLTLAESTPCERVDLTRVRSLAIDDEGSDDPDDAVGFADGLLYVHVADPAAAIAPGDPVDLEARGRGATCYLPEGIATMLPEAATAVFGLGLQPTSPALTFGIEIAPDGNVTLKKLLLSTVRVERFTYESAAAVWNEPPLREIRAALEPFRERRRLEGALFIKLPEVKTKVVDGDVVITPCPVTPERELVANAMLAAGHAVAKFMAERGGAFPFVTQAPPETDERGESLSAMYALRRNSAPSMPGPVAGRHFGLGLEPYARVTSPLRRYADLWAHYQLRRVILEQPLLSIDDLEAALAPSEVGSSERRKLERYSDEYWLMVYFACHPDWKGSGVLIDRQGDRLTFAVPEFAYLYKCRYQGRIAVGDEVGLELKAVDPAALRAVFHIVAKYENKPRNEEVVE